MQDLEDCELYHVLEVEIVVTTYFLISNIKLSSQIHLSML